MILLGRQVDLILNLLQTQEGPHSPQIGLALAGLQDLMLNLLQTLECHHPPGLALVGLQIDPILSLLQTREGPYSPQTGLALAGLQVDLTPNLL
jgi:hypothetical protein